jgi:hypothetical protein
MQPAVQSTNTLLANAVQPTTSFIAFFATAR